MYLTNETLLFETALIEADKKIFILQWYYIADYFDRAKV